MMRSLLEVTKHIMQCCHVDQCHLSCRRSFQTFLLIFFSLTSFFLKKTLLLYVWETRFELWSSRSRLARELSRRIYTLRYSFLILVWFRILVRQMQSYKQSYETRYEGMCTQLNRICEKRDCESVQLVWYIMLLE